MSQNYIKLVFALWKLWFVTFSDHHSNKGDDYVIDLFYVLYILLATMYVPITCIKIVLQQRS